MYTAEGQPVGQRRVRAGRGGELRDAVEGLARRGRRRVGRRSRRGGSDGGSRGASEGGPNALFTGTVDAQVGARLAGRLANLRMQDGSAHQQEVAYPEIGGRLVVRPWVEAEGLERGLELTGSFWHAVGLRSRNTITDEPVDSGFFRAYGEIAIMFEPDPAVQLGLTAGFGWDSYALGEQVPLVLPTAEYAYLRPGLRGRFALEGRLLTLEVDLGYRGVLGRGALSEHFGEGGETQGFDVTARLGGSLDVGFAYAVEAGVVPYFHFFSGDAVTSAGRDGTDIGLWLGASVGLAL
jgi:hypothetical protein